MILALVASILIQSVSPWPSGVMRWLRSFARVHATVRRLSTAMAHTGRQHSLQTAALGMGCSTLTCSVWVNSARYTNPRSK